MPIHLVNIDHSDIDPDASLEQYDAYDRAGEKLGHVDSIIVDADSMEPRYLVVDSGGWFISKKFVVPVDDVGRIDDSQKRVIFDILDKATLESGRYPRYDETWWEQNDYQSFSAHEQAIARAYAPGGTVASATDYAGRVQTGEPEQRALAAAEAGSTAVRTERVSLPSERIEQAGGAGRRSREAFLRLQRIEERLRLSKERSGTGEAGFGRRLTEYPEGVQAPVRDDFALIERDAASETVSDR